MGYTCTATEQVTGGRYGTGVEFPFVLPVEEANAYGKAGEGRDQDGEERGEGYVEIIDAGNCF